MTEPISMDQVFIRQMTDIVLANLRNEKFGVGELAREAGISRITIYRKIKSIKNQDTGRFIREIRLNRAMELLRQKVGTVSEIAYMVGFSSPAYFNKCFQEFFGFPPGKVKKQAISDREEITPFKSGETPEHKRVFQRPFAIHLAAGLSFIILLVIGYFLLIRSGPGAGRSSSPAGPLKSIAVLPFRNLTDSASNRYIVDGIAEEIRANLSKIHDLEVKSRISTEQYRETRKAASEIGRKLDLDYLVDGSIQKYGNKITLWVNLTEASTDRQIWSQRYERVLRQPGDIFGIQSRIAQAIASELKATITPEEKRLIEKSPTTNLTALDFYQRGREELGKFQFHDLIVTSTTYPIFFDNPLNLKEIEKARNLFTAALRYDSTFAPAYVELAAISWSENYFREYFSENYLDSVLILVNKALSFDDQLPDAYYMRAMYYGETGNIKQARLDFDKTLQLDPNHWQAYYGKGALYLEEFPDADYTVALENFLEAVSRHHGSARQYLLKRIAYALNISGFSDLALKYNLEASQLEMDSAAYFNSLGELTVWSGGDALKARHYADEAYRRDSNNILRMRGEIFNCMGKDDYRSALRIYRKYRGLLNENGITMVNEVHRWGFIYEALGMKDSAEYYYNKQIEYCNTAIRLGRPYGLSFAYLDLAMIYFQKNDRTRTLENLVRFSNREGMCAWFGIWEPLNKDPEFQKLDHKIRTKYQAEHERVGEWLRDKGMI